MVDVGAVAVRAGWPDRAVRAGFCGRNCLRIVRSNWGLILLLVAFGCEAKRTESVLKEKEIPSAFEVAVREAVDDTKSLREIDRYSRHLKRLNTIGVQPTDEQEAVLSQIAVRLDLWLQECARRQGRYKEIRDYLMAMQRMVFAKTSDGTLSDPRVKQIWSQVVKEDGTKALPWYRPWEEKHPGTDEFMLVHGFSEHLLTEHLTKDEVFLLLFALRSVEASTKVFRERDRTFDEWCQAVPWDVLVNRDDANTVRRVDSYPLDFERVYRMNLTDEEFRKYVQILSAVYPDGDRRRYESKIKAYRQQKKRDDTVLVVGGNEAPVVPLPPRDELGKEVRRPTPSAQADNPFYHEMATYVVGHLRRLENLDKRVRSVPTMDQLQADAALLERLLGDDSVAK